MVDFNTWDEHVQVPKDKELRVLASSMASQTGMNWSGDFVCGACQCVGAHFPLVPPWHFWTEARDEGRRHGGVTRPKSRCIANIGRCRAEVYGSHGSERPRCFDAVTAAAAQNGILVCLGGAAKSAIDDEAGKAPMSIDRLITSDQDEANVA